MRSPLLTLFSSGRSFSPSSISGLQWFVEADNPLNTLNGSQVAVLDDKSANGWDATQITETQQPTLVTGDLNGKSVLSFDGGDFYAMSGGAMGILRNKPGASIFMLVKTTTTGAGTINILTLSIGTAAGSRCSILRNANKIQLGVRRLDTDSANSITSSVSISTSAYVWIEAIVDYENGVLKLRLGNNEEETLTVTTGWGAATASANSNSSAFILGASTATPSLLFSGKMPFVAIYDRALTNTERDYLRRGFSDKYNLGLTFSPLLIPNLQWFVEADNPENTLNGSYVSVLADKSPNGWDAPQVTGTLQAALVTGELNGQKALSFDTDDTYDPTGAALGILRNKPGASAFMLFKPGSIGSGSFNIFGIWTAGALSRFAVSRATDKIILLARRLDADTVRTITSTPTLSTSAYVWVEAIVDYANGILKLRLGNNSEETLVVPSGWAAATATEDTNSSAFFFRTTTSSGKVPFVLIYDRVLTSTERASLRRYFSDKYNLGLT